MLSRPNVQIEREVVSRPCIALESENTRDIEKSLPWGLKSLDQGGSIYNRNVARFKSDQTVTLYFWSVVLLPRIVCGSGRRATHGARPDRDDDDGSLLFGRRT